MAGNNNPSDAGRRIQANSRPHVPQKETLQIVGYTLPRWWVFGWQQYVGIAVK